MNEQLDRLCRQVWGAYEYLKEHDLSGQSGTSKRLRAGQSEKLQARLLEELGELRGVIEGTHFHEGFDQDIILEGYEVWYWAVCTAISLGLSFEQVNPAHELAEGFQDVPASRPGLLAAFDDLIAHLSPASLDNLPTVFRLVGSACSLNATPPLRLIERDRTEMGQKDYLAAYWTQLV